MPGVIAGLNRGKRCRDNGKCEDFFIVQFIFFLQFNMFLMYNLICMANLRTLPIFSGAICQFLLPHRMVLSSDKGLASIV